MINTVVSSSKLLQINVGSDQKPYINPTALSSGQVRYNPSLQKLEILDGGSCTWHEVPGEFVSIDFAHEVEETLIWAREQMRKEQEWRKIAENNQSVKSALDNYQQSKATIELLTILTKNSDDSLCNKQ